MENTEEENSATDGELFNDDNQAQDNDMLSKNIIFELLLQAQRGAGKRPSCCLELTHKLLILNLWIS